MKRKYSKSLHYFSDLMMSPDWYYYIWKKIKLNFLRSVSGFVLDIHLSGEMGPNSQVFVISLQRNHCAIPAEPTRVGYTSVFLGLWPKLFRSRSPPFVDIWANLMHSLSGSFIFNFESVVFGFQFRVRQYNTESKLTNSQVDSVDKCQRFVSISV